MRNGEALHESPDKLASNKAKAYVADIDSRIFVNAEYVESQHLANRSGKMVYCTEIRQMLYPDSLGGHLRQVRRKSYSFIGRFIPSSAHKVIRNVVFGKPCLDRKQFGSP